MSFTFRSSACKKCYFAYIELKTESSTATTQRSAGSCATAESNSSWKTVVPPVDGSFLKKS